MPHDHRPTPTLDRPKPFLYERITCYYEGLTSEGHKDGAWSFTVFADETRGTDQNGVIKKLAENSGFLPRCNNPLVAKFTGLGYALQWLVDNKKMDFPHIVCKGSHLMVTRHMNRQVIVTPKHDYRSLWRECIKLAAPFYDLQFQWISQIENKDCWNLAFSALETGLASHV